MSKKQEADASFTNWGNLFSDMWDPMMAYWGDMFKSQEAQQAPGLKGRMGESLQTTAKMWQAMFGAMSEPETAETFQKAMQMTPDVALGFTQSCLKGFTSFQEQTQEWFQKRSAAKDPLDIQALDKEFIRRWNEAYEEEFSRYLKVPQIGMTRFYQERAMNAADKFNLFQGALSEFLHMLYLPMEKAFKSLQEKLVEMTAEEGALDQKSKTYYNLWIKLLEGHYMELFKEPEFVMGLSKTLEAFEDCTESRQAVVNDLLKMFDIPTQNDLDELYKEIYHLKKRLRASEKKK